MNERLDFPDEGLARGCAESESEENAVELDWLGLGALFCICGCV
jgi:hypothetical protein